MKNHFFKVLSLILFITLLINVTYADDEDFENDISINEFSQAINVSSKILDAPSINAKYAVILDRNSRKILYGKNETKICKMASTTKIMTAIIVLENSNLDNIVTVSKKAAGTGGSRLGLSTNDKLTVENLLYGLMLKSGNDAAVALAEHIGGNIENFALLMNQKAKELNLLSTNFVTPHGLDNDKHYTTAFDLACLTDYALENEVFSKIVKTKTYTILINDSPKTLSNTNELLGNLEGIYGVKTGFTNGANRCLVTACRRGDLDIICIVLGCDTKKNRTQDSINLINYIFKNFSLINIKDILINDFNKWSSSNTDCFTINKGISQSLNLALDSEDFSFSHMAVNNSDLNNIKTEISFDSYFEAPLPQNTRVGKIILKINNDEYLSIDILTFFSIPKKNYFDYIFYIFKNYRNFFTIQK